jgi:hypothetical protein
MPSKTNEPDDLALERAFGPGVDRWHGVGYRVRTSLAPDRARARRNYSDGAIGRVWDVDTPRVPSAPTDAPFVETHTRGDGAFSSSDMGALGRPRRPGKP